MSLVPSIEAILLQVHQSLGLSGQYSTDQKRDFATGQRCLDKHAEMFAEIFDDICDKLGMDWESRSRQDLFRNLEDIGNFNQNLGLRIWTFAADRRQVLWQLLGHSYVPAVARCAAHWNLSMPMDAGMSLGRFWYLPELREQDGEPRLHLPVANVVDWLLDLVGMPLQALADGALPASAPDQASDAWIHSLHNWRDETVPEASTINKYFPDSMKIAFRGALELDDQQPLHKRFAQAQAFVKRKGLTIEQLSQEIPFTPDDLRRILQGAPSEEDQEYLVHWLCVRYAVPTPALIRERLLFARMVQDGYVRLLQELCPGVDRRCVDPQQNKVLQLVGIYQKVYNLTQDAHREHGRGDSGWATPAEDAWFEGQIPLWDRLGLLLSILPSLSVEERLAELAEMLTLKFFDAVPGEPLEDHVGLDLPSNHAISIRKIEHLKAREEQKENQARLLERLQLGDPEGELRAETDYWIVNQTALDTRLSHEARGAAVRRMYELAATPIRQVGAIVVDLMRYQPTSGEHPNRARDRVEALLADAKACAEGYVFWRAPLLLTEARHHLSCNDAEEAKRLFRRALDACGERNYGQLRGAIARDLFAIEVADQKLIPNNHERYFREMWFGGEFEGPGLPSIEDAARQMSDYFWGDLYRPYPGVERREPLAADAISELWERIMGEDAEGVRAWVRRNKKLLKTSLRTVTGDSVLMSTIKTAANVPAPLLGESITAALRRGIITLVEQAPAQLNIVDFKGQTPLMLMTEAADQEIVRLMLDHGADPDLRDYEGRSALHSAVRSRDIGCVEALIERGCKPDVVTSDGQSALHTAVRFGNILAAKLLIDRAPQLKEMKNADGQTPLFLAGLLLADPSVLGELRLRCMEKGSRCATRDELELLVHLL